VLRALGHQRERELAFVDLPGSALFFGIVASLYLNSAVRLRQAG
jgi:hypothetical protein